MVAPNQVGPIGPQNTGKDFNFYQEVVVSGTSSFPSVPQVVMGFRGARRMMFICTTGSVFYSFNGNTIHGKADSATASNKLDFGTRMEDKIWVYGTGTLQVHCWQIGV